MTFVVLWTLLVFLSIVWYAFLLFYIGIKGGIEIKQMTKDLQQRNEPVRPNSRR